MIDNFETGYLYTMYGGKLKVYEGHVEPGRWDTGKFIAQRDIIRTYRHTCNNKPGIVTNASVWLPEKNDTKAVDILVRYEMIQIEACEERIANHKLKIKMLQEAVP